MALSASIPKERIGALIGKGGKAKALLEEKLNVRIKIESETGIVEVEPKEEATDPVTLLKARNIVLAIGRGFALERALALADDDMILDVIDLRQIFGKNESTLRRIKGRVIGKEGRFKRLIEEITGAMVSVYGHTISLIGEFDAVAIAREAIQKLLEGRQHGTVYRFLIRAKREMDRKRATALWEEPLR